VKVLIVDDSPMIAERIAVMLSEVSRDIRVVGREGEERAAVRAVGQLKPDVLVLDLRLASGSGIGTLEQVKRTAPDTTVMVLTNYPYPQYRRRCSELGADFFFDKSTEFDRLRAAFLRLMEAPKPPPGGPGRGPRGGE